MYMENVHGCEEISLTQVREWIATFPNATVVETELGFHANFFFVEEKTHGFYHLAPCEDFRQCHTLTRMEESLNSDKARNRAVEDDREFIDVQAEAKVKAETKSSPKAKARPKKRKFKRKKKRTKFPTRYPTRRPSPFPSSAAMELDPDCLHNLVSEDERVCCALSSGACEILSEVQERALASCDHKSPPCSLITVQKVAVLYSPETKAGVRDVKGLIDLAIAETNSIYKYSRIPIRIELVYSSVTPFSENGDSYWDLLAIRGIGVSQFGANIGVFITYRMGSCGRAYMDCTQYPKGTTCGYAVVRASCATGYYSFAHELGHIQGADHNSAFPSLPQTRFGDNFGYILPKGALGNEGFRTVMAYDMNMEIRLPLFSNPDVRFRDVPVGVRGSANNARVLRQTRRDVANL